MRNGSVQSWPEIVFLYDHSFRDYLVENLENKGLNINELFDKMSIKYKDLDGSHTFKFSFLGRTVNKSLPGQIKKELDKIYLFDTYEYTGEPLETIVIRKLNYNFDNREEYKCLSSATSRGSG